MSPASRSPVSRSLPPWGPADLALAICDGGVQGEPGAAPRPLAVLDGLTCAGHRCALVAWAPSRRASTLDSAFTLVPSAAETTGGAPALLAAVVGALAWDGRAEFWLPTAAAVFDYDAGALWLRGDAAVAAADQLDAARLGEAPGRPAPSRMAAVPASLSDTGGADAAPSARRTEARPLWSEESFQGMVRQAQAQMAAGFIDKAVLSVPFRASCDLSPAQVYQRVAAQPAQGLKFLLDSGDGGWALIGTSPEPLVSLRDGRAEMHLLAGTRPVPAEDASGRSTDAAARGGPAAPDAPAVRDGPAAPDEASRNLAASEKDRREHLLALEQARRDLERVCAPGTVAVEALLTLERHPGLVHLASHLAGRLRPDASAADLVRAVFPTGTVAGVPKAAAIDLISRLEPLPRGWYAGAVGVLLPGGDLELWLVLRTVLLQGGVATVRTGAGIVAESDPGAEWRECLAKAAPTLALINAEVTCDS